MDVSYSLYPAYCNLILDLYEYYYFFRMMSRDLSNWNVVMERNVSECLNILNQWNLEQLELSKEVQDFMLNISSHHHCDPKVLFYTVLAGVGHFAEAISVFNMETKQIKPISVYEILIAPSGM